MSRFVWVRRIPFPRRKRLGGVKGHGGARLVTFQQLIKEQLTALPWPFVAERVEINLCHTMDAWEIRALMVPHVKKEEN